MAQAEGESEEIKTLISQADRLKSEVNNLSRLLEQGTPG
jgi:hypothetical protein